MSRILRKILTKFSALMPDGKVKKIIKRAYIYFLSLVNDDIHTSDFDLFCRKIKKIQKHTTINRYWTETKEWNFSRQKDRYEIMVDWLNQKIIPLLNKNSVVADLGCANGEFSFLIAKYVKSIDGFDLSDKMIELAKRRSSEMNIINVNFQQADAQTIIFSNKKYDCFMIFGLVIYIIDDDALDMLLRKIYAAMNVDSYLVIKDCLTTNGGGGGGGI